jgi:hypothetical protein
MKICALIILLLVLCFCGQSCFMPVYTSFLSSGKGNHSIYIGATGSTNPYRNYDPPYMENDSTKSFVPEDIGASRFKALSLGYRYGVIHNMDVGPNIMLIQMGNDYNKESIRPAIGVEWKANFFNKFSVAGELGIMYRHKFVIIEDEPEWTLLSVLYSLPLFGGCSARYGKVFGISDAISIGPRLAFISTHYYSLIEDEVILGMFMLGAGYEKILGSFCSK